MRKDKKLVFLVQSMIPWSCARTAGSTPDRVEPHMWDTKDNGTHYCVRHSFERLRERERESQVAGSYSMIMVELPPLFNVVSFFFLPYTPASHRESRWKGVWSGSELNMNPEKLYGLQEDSRNEPKNYSTTREGVTSKQTNKEEKKMITPWQSSSTGETSGIILVRYYHSTPVRVWVANSKKKKREKPMREQIVELKSH